MNLPRHIFRQSPQFGIERNVSPPPRLAIEQCACGNRNTKHLLQTQCLGAKLNFVGTMRLRRSTFVLYRERSPISAAPGQPRRHNSSTFVLLRFQPMELHHVRDACQAKALRCQAKRRREMDITPCLAPPPVHALMQLPTSGCEEVLAPNALNMNERTLPRAEQIVL
jgi:hypothetical protein